MEETLDVRQNINSWPKEAIGPYPGARPLILDILLIIRYQRQPLEKLNTCSIFQTVLQSI